MSEPRAALAARFGVAIKTIERVCRGVTWKHVKPRRSVKKRVLICAECQKRFKQGVMGGPRKFCDDCRSARQRARKFKIRMNTLEQQLRPMVERLVREALIEAGVLKGPNGATRVVVQKLYR